jgi:hypothetical protein
LVATSDCASINKPRRQIFENHSFPWIANMAGCRARSWQLELTGGIDKLAIDLDLGAARTESSNSFALAPAILDIGGVAIARRARQRPA